MTRIELAGWVLECDPGATARALAELPAGAPEACGCASCRNFAAARQDTYGPEFRALLAALGAPPNREAEVYECGPAERWGWRRYGGWFHVIGRVVRDPLVDAAPVGRPFVALAPGFEVFFTGGGSLVPAVLKGQPVVQIEFEAEVPWVLAEPAPEP
jgi:hypothetical protein